MTPYIGTAEMKPDGTLVLTLRAEDDQGHVGIGQILYPPTDPDYQKVLAHIGALKPGDKKPVLPFPSTWS